MATGPFDVVFVSGWVISNLEVAWEGSAGRFYEEMGSFCRLIIFDKRGTGLSDRITGIPDLQTRMDDVRAVMDAVGSTRAAMLGFSEGGPMGDAVRRFAPGPSRCPRAVRHDARPIPRASDYPWGLLREEILERIREADRSGRRLTDEWCDEYLRALAPSIADDDKARFLWRRWVRVSASPSDPVAASAG